MRMTIDEAIGVSETCQYILSNQVGSNWCKSKYDAVTIAIDIMRKYKQIEQILDDCDLEAWEILEQVKEVVRGEK